MFHSYHNSLETNANCMHKINYDLAKSMTMIPSQKYLSNFNVRNESQLPSQSFFQAQKYLGYDIVDSDDIQPADLALAAWRVSSPQQLFDTMKAKAYVELEKLDYLIKQDLYNIHFSKDMLQNGKNNTPNLLDLGVYQDLRWFSLAEDFFDKPPSTNVNADNVISLDEPINGPIQPVSVPPLISQPPQIEIQPPFLKPTSRRDSLMRYIPLFISNKNLMEDTNNQQGNKSSETPSSTQREPLYVALTKPGQACERRRSSGSTDPMSEQDFEIMLSDSPRSIINPNQGEKKRSISFKSWFPIIFNDANNSAKEQKGMISTKNQIDKNRRRSVGHVFPIPKQKNLSSSSQKNSSPISSA